MKEFEIVLQEDPDVLYVGEDPIVKRPSNSLPTVARPNELPRLLETQLLGYGIKLMNHTWTTFDGNKLVDLDVDMICEISRSDTFQISFRLCSPVASEGFATVVARHCFDMVCDPQFDHMEGRELGIDRLRVDVQYRHDGMMRGNGRHG